MKQLLIIISLLINYGVMAQNSYEQCVEKMNLGEEQLLLGNFKQADALIRDAMYATDSFPNKLAYLFGRNSYHLNRFKQSINWLNKYIELTDGKGDDHQDAVHYLVLSIAEYKAEEAAAVAREKEAEQQKTDSLNHNCNGRQVLCPACQGSGVLRRAGKLGVQYITCPFSGESGRLSCEDFNAYLKGNLEQKY